MFLELTFRVLSFYGLFRNSIMRSNFMVTQPLLNMARTMCEALHSQSLESESSSPELIEELHTLLRLYRHHQGVLGLHTNQPSVSLKNLQIFRAMLEHKLREMPSEGTDQSLGVCWNELGNAVLQNNDMKKAEEYFKKSIAVLGALDNATEITISMPLINLGFTYWVQGRLSDAAATFQRALEDRENKYGVDDQTSFV